MLELYSECFTKFLSQPLGLFSFYTVPIVLFLTIHMAYFEFRYRNYYVAHAAYFTLVGWANYWALFTGEAMFGDCLSPILKPALGYVLLVVSLCGMTYIMNRIVTRELKCTSSMAARFQIHWFVYLAVIFILLIAGGEPLRYYY